MVEVEVRRGPQRSESQWRSGEAHCDQDLADEVRRGLLRSRGSSEAHCDQELAEELREEYRARRTRKEGRRTPGQSEEGRSRASDIKSNNPHLAGGEKHSGS